MGALGLGLALALAQALGITPFAYDAGAYYRAEPGNLYPVASWANAPYQYSPAFADALIPFRLLPERVFTGLWQLALVLTLTATIRSWALPVIAVGYLTQLPLVSAVASDVALGNIHVLLGAVAVFGIRWPVLWSLALLSKVTPGIGIVWFAARGEWRNLAIAVGVSAGIAALSFLWLPGDWFAWPAHLLALSGDVPDSLVVLPVPLWVRLLSGAAIVWWGGRTNRPWVVPIAVGWCIPMPYGTMLATMIAALHYVSPRTGRLSRA